MKIRLLNRYATYEKGTVLDAETLGQGVVDTLILFRHAEVVKDIERPPKHKAIYRAANRK